MGTGIRDMIDRCWKAGLPEPEFRLTDGFVATIRRKPNRAFEAVGGQSSGEAVEQDEAHEEAHDEAHEPMSEIEKKILMTCRKNPKNSSELLQRLGYKTRTGNFKKAVRKLLNLNYLEMQIPGKPRSKSQKYRLTKKGAGYLKS